MSNNYAVLNPKEKELLNCLKGLYTDILYSASNRPIDRKKLFSELKKIEELLKKLKKVIDVHIQIVINYMDLKFH